MFVYLAVPAVSAAVLLKLAWTKLSARGRAKALTFGLLAVNGAVLAAVAVMLLVGFPAFAQEEARDGDREQPAVEKRGQDESAGNTAIGAALATGLATIGAGIAVGITDSAAIGGITQKPEILGRTLIFVGLAEGIAIYGLIASFMILTGALG